MKTKKDSEILWKHPYTLNIYIIIDLNLALLSRYLQLLFLSHNSSEECFLKVELCSDIVLLVRAILLLKFTADRVLDLVRGWQCKICITAFRKRLKRKAYTNGFKADCTAMIMNCKSCKYCRVSQLHVLHHFIVYITTHAGK